MKEDEKPLRLRADRVSWREIDDEIVAVNVATSTYVSANASGRVLWRALAEGATREDLVDTLVGAFGIDRAQAGGDVDRFVAELAENGLLEEP